jgi:2-C-methyl-D-erythritol 2,4-cyclodiphosphate synthase
MMRIGMGYDSHRLVPGGPLRIGGTQIPFDKHLEGHSDADVLLHAVSDALLGAAALGDIGHWFPDTEPANQNRDSAELLVACYEKVRQQGYQLVNADCIVHAQQPKIGPHREEIREIIAGLLEVQTGCLSVKAKTGEGLGPVGRGEMIQAQCAVLLQAVTIGTEESGNRTE